MNDFHTQTTHTAKKLHRCACSFAQIQPGEKYVRFTGVADGEFYSEAVREDIAVIYNRWSSDAWLAGDDGIPFCELADYVFDMLPDAQAEADCQALVAANPKRHEERWLRYCAEQVARVITETMNAVALPTASEPHPNT